MRAVLAAAAILLLALVAPPVHAKDVKCASPCGNVTHYLTVPEVRAYLYKVAMEGYAARSHEHYSENMTKRWTGIHEHICPPQIPVYSDCSSFVTWIYWTLFGNGVDFLNGEQWGAGYTGTLKVHGKAVDPAVNATKYPTGLAVGDLCFYYHPMHHVAIYVGDGKVVTHGMDPVGHYAWDYAPVDYCRRYVF